MRILQIDNQPFYTCPYRTAARGGGIQHALFPLFHAKVDRLPEGCEALLAGSDMQGLADEAGPPRLLGEALAEELALLAGLDELPPADRVGVLLCGDLYVRPLLDARGGLGDVRPVWRAFARYFRWVAGVPGNHDDFGGPEARAAFAAEPGIHLLDGGSATVGGLRIAGLGGIIGASGKPNRRSERSFTRALEHLLAEQPDLLLLHQGPDLPEQGLVGEPRIRQVLHHASLPLVLCGHTHWPSVLATMPQGPQVANLDGRGLLLTL